MALGAPKIIGRVSECSVAFRVSSQKIGSTVEISENGNIVASRRNVGWSDVTMPLQGAALTAGNHIRVRQALNGESSDFNESEDVVVDPRPSQSEINQATVNFPTPLYVCGSLVYVENILPGATVAIQIGGNRRVPWDPVIDGIWGREGDGALFQIPQGIGIGERLEAQQTICGNLAGPISVSEEPSPIPTENKILKPPTIEVPEDGLIKCDRVVTVKNVVEGAEVILTRRFPNGLVNTISTFFYFSRNSFVNLEPPLQAGENLVAVQRFQTCGIESPPSTLVTVLNLQLSRPRVREPLCEGSQEITLEGLRPGADVEIYIIAPDGTLQSRRYTAPDNLYNSNVYSFRVPPLIAGEEIKAAQGLCGNITELPQHGVKVRPAPVNISAPVIPGPLYECSSKMHITNVRVGAKLLVYSANDSPNTTLNTAPSEIYFEPEIDVSLRRQLIATDLIYARQTGCGTLSDPSNEAPVQRAMLLPPQIGEVDECMCYYVNVTNVSAGAQVDVFSKRDIEPNWFWQGRLTVTTAANNTQQVSIPIRRCLVSGERIKARQRLCQTTAFGPEGRAERCCRWNLLEGENRAQILAVHAVLLRTGKILYFGGNQNRNDFNLTHNVDHTRLFDCNTYEVTQVFGLSPIDVFCCGHSVLSDGKVLVAGGSERPPMGEDDPLIPEQQRHVHKGVWTGIKESWIFDPEFNQWIRTGSMNLERGNNRPKSGGRWYPTLLSLPNNRVLALSGHPGSEDHRHGNSMLEWYSALTSTWEIIGDDDYYPVGMKVEPAPNPNDSDEILPITYPRIFSLPNGNIFCATPLNMPAGGRIDTRYERWTPNADIGTNWSTVVSGLTGGEGVYRSISFSAVLLPLLPEETYQKSRILICGGSNAYLIDLSQNPPTWQQAGQRTLTATPPQRINVNTVILPTGEIFVCGGVQKSDDDSTAVKTAEMYDPWGLAPGRNNWPGPITGLGSWKNLEAASVVRNYHSVALLIPDGAVWTAGSNKDSMQINREMRIEIYRPWYFCHDRPTINIINPPSYPHPYLAFGRRFQISSPQANGIRRVAIIRCGSVTHSFDCDQRYIDLKIESINPNTNIISVWGPPDSSVGIPGYYLLFIIDNKRVPSRGRFVRIGP